MANKTRFWTKEELQEFNLIDTTPRLLRGKDTVEVKCRSCNATGKTKFSYLRSKMITHKLTWRCAKCLTLEKSERGKLLTGHKNPFYGKKHTQKTCQQMKVSSRKRWDNTPKTVRDQIGKTMRRCAYDKYGGNPMSDPIIRERFLAGVRSFFTDEQKVLLWHQRRMKTNIQRYGHPVYTQSEEYLKENERFKSKAESEIANLFNGLGFETKKRRIDGVELDVYIPELNLAIEYNGSYWHSEIYRPKNYHLFKTEYCNSQGINLIHIFDHEWFSRRSQIENFLSSKTGTLTRIGARVCEVRQITNKEAQDFVEKYHIQGKSPGSILCLGLFHCDNLVSVAIFGKHHRQYNKVVLKRFVSKFGISVAGGLSRLSKAGSKILKTDIITWCDRRWTDGQTYLKAGWEPEEMLPPDYFYIKNGRFYCKKQSRRKAVVNTPKEMTEHEHALQDGLYRVYDCGKLRMVYRYVVP